MSHALASAAAPARSTRSRGTWIALAIAVGLAGGLTAAAIGRAAGTPELDGRVLAARYTARFAFLLFLPVYLASSWRRLAPSAAARRALVHRRALGLGFASAQAVHLGALIAAVRASGSAAAPDLATIVGGGGAYVLTFAMAATSNDAAMRRLGRHWKTLHRVGIHWIWLVFAISYGGRLAAGEGFFAPFVALALGALGLRVAARRR